MTLLVDATNVVVDTDEHTENYEDDDAKATQQVAKKVTALETPPRDSSGQAETLGLGEDRASEREAARRLSGAPPVRIRCSPSRRP